MYQLKLIKHYKNNVHRIHVYYLQFEYSDEKYMTLNKKEYEKIVKRGYIEI